MGLRLNIGSGQRRFEGWTNVDKVYDRAHITVGDKQVPSFPDVAADGGALPFADESCEMVVLHHVLEHFGLGEGDGLIREAHRVIHPGGALLVFVPDSRALATRWLMGRIDTYTFMVNLHGAYQGRETDRHRWNFDSASLKQTLASAAQWRTVKPFDWRDVGADVVKDWWITAAEAVK